MPQSFEDFLREKMKKSALFGSYRFDAGEWCDLAEEWHAQELVEVREVWKKLKMLGVPMESELKKEGKI